MYRGGHDATIASSRADGILPIATVALAVALSGVAIMIAGWPWSDPVIGMIIVGVIVYGTWGLLRDSMELALNAVPSRIDVVHIDAFRRSLPGSGGYP